MSLFRATSCRVRGFPPIGHATAKAKLKVLLPSHKWFFFKHKLAWSKSHCCHEHPPHLGIFFYACKVSDFLHATVLGTIRVKSTIALYLSRYFNCDALDSQTGKHDFLFNLEHYNNEKFCMGRNRRLEQTCVGIALSTPRDFAHIG